MRERTDLDKKPTWYLFLAANVIVFIGAIVTYVLFRQANVADKMINFVPTLVCNLVGLGLCGLFIWLEAKGIMNKAMHFQRKWLYWYLTALIIFVVSIIFSFAYFAIFRTKFFDPSSSVFEKTWPLIIDVVLVGVLTLVSIGFQRYARYKIDLDIYKRNRGELPKKEEMEKDKAKLEKQEAKQNDEQAPSDEKLMSGSYSGIESNVIL